MRDAHALDLLRRIKLLLVLDDRRDEVLALERENEIFVDAADADDFGDLKIFRRHSLQPDVFPHVFFVCLVDPLDGVVRHAVVRHAHHEAQVEIARCGFAVRRNAFASDAETPSALRARRNFDIDRAARRRHRDGRAVYGFADSDRQVHFEVASVPCEKRMRADARRNVEVAGRPAARARLALAGHANALAGLGARRNVDTHGLLPHHAAGAAASRTRIAGNLPGAAAGRAGLPKLHRPFGDRYRPAAFALGTRFRRRAGLGARAVACLAFDWTIDRERRLKTAHGVEEVDVHSRFDVVPALRSGARGASAPATGAERAAEAAENIAEVVEIEFLRVEAAAESAGGAAGPRARRLLLPLFVAARLVGVEAGGEARLAEFVVELALLRVAQHVVGNRDIFEFALGLFVAGIDVGVILARELAVRFADIVVGCAALDAQNFVEVAVGHANLER